MSADNIAHPDIESISEFMGWVNSVCPQDVSGLPLALFYRGHADAAYTVQPGAYRIKNGGSHRANESRLFHEMLRRDPAAFSSDQTVFERLVRMQHYGLPTRLLDLTQNPLVALYFACATQPEKNGVVLSFAMTHRDVLHQQTLPVISMAGVDQPLDFSQLGAQISASACRVLEEEIRNLTTLDSGGVFVALMGYLSQCLEQVNRARQVGGQFHDLFVVSAALQHFDDETNRLCKECNDKLKNQTECSQDEKLAQLQARKNLERFQNRLRDWEDRRVAELRKQMCLGINQLQQRLPEFLNSLTRFFVVFPPMNNERIRRQRGAFMVFPPGKSDFWKVENFISPTAVAIKAAAKQHVLQELAHQGITRSYLFPELEEQTRDICSLYPPVPDATINLGIQMPGT